MTFFFTSIDKTSEGLDPLPDLTSCLERVDELKANQFLMLPLILARIGAGARIRKYSRLACGKLSQG